MIEAALNLLQVIHDRESAYRDAMKAIKNLNPDFPPVDIPAIDGAIETAALTLVDAVLGDDIGSYWLTEAVNMKDGGAVEFNGVRYPIRTIDDVRAYLQPTKQG